MAFRKPIPKVWWWLLTLVLVVAINVLEFHSNPELTFAFLYLAPISIATWFLGLRVGLLFVTLVGFDWAIDGCLNHRQYAQIWYPFWNATLRTATLIVMATLLDRLRRSRDDERRLARKDPLTGLPNMREFYERLEAESQWSKRLPEPVTVAYLDLDNFKTVNDRWGHETGNDVLKAITKVLQTNLREVDTAARLGGDEFAILLPRTSADNALNVVNKLQTSLRLAMQERQWPVTVSIGMVTYHQLPESAREILSTADHLMYSVKRHGKDRITQQIIAN